MPLVKPQTGAVSENVFLSSLLTPCLAFLTLFSPLAWAQKPDILNEVSVHQNINEKVPLNTTFYNEDGKKVRLADDFTGKPVLMTFIYYGCSMLCPLNLQSLARSLKNLDLSPGKDYQFVAMSFDPADLGGDSKGERKKFLGMLGTSDSAGIHFLTGPEPSIRKVTKAVGFQYAKDEDTNQYAHTTALVVLTPEGRIARYFFGLDYPTRDIRLALMEAQDSKTGSVVQAVLLFCFCYQPQTGHYTLAILNLLKVAGVLTLIVLGTLFYLLKKQET